MVFWSGHFAPLPTKVIADHRNGKPRSSHSAPSAKKCIGINGMSAAIQVFISLYSSPRTACVTWSLRAVRNGSDATSTPKVVVSVNLFVI